VTARQVVSAEVAEALAEGRPMVALETSVLAQGLPHPRNLDAARAMEGAIRDAGAVPAWTWVEGGRVRFGAAWDDVERLGSPQVPTSKVARRDLPAVVAGAGLGATTVSATLWIAYRAGVEVMATGGIGGVHLGTGDVSADLLEMATTPGTVVCSGPKSIVDPLATLERLEELGVLVVGYRCERLPFFLAREADVALEHHVRGPKEAAAFVRARRELSIDSAVLVCNPIPEANAMPAGEVAQAVRACEGRAEELQVTGKDLTPFLLRCLAERTNGASLEANLALLENNARVAAEIALELADGAPGSASVS